MSEDPELNPGMEPLTPEEKEAFLRRVRAQGRSLTSEEQYALFGPPPEAEAVPRPEEEEIDEMEAAYLSRDELAALAGNFFPDLPNDSQAPEQRLIQGIIFDFDYTLASLTQPIDDLMQSGAKAAADYMRTTGMELPDEVYRDIVDARVFAEEKSEEEQEEHIADDALSFLLQFIGYPASKMDAGVLRQAVDILYAPEMTAWQLMPGVSAVLDELRAGDYKLALLANYNCDRVFQRTIDFLGLRPYFDICICSASVEYRKPDTRLFELVLERWDALPYETVVVGDSLAHDIQGGIEVGAQTILADLGTTAQVAFTNQQLADDVKPDATITDLHQVLSLIHDWAQA